MGTSIKQLANMIAKMSAFNGDILWGRIPERPLDIAELIGSYHKAQRLLGWKPQYALENGLAICIDYWRNKLDTNPGLNETKAFMA